MPHAIDEQELLGDQEERDYQLLLNPESNITFLDELADVGEKADDAQDFEDISDTDLPDEEEDYGQDEQDGNDGQANGFHGAGVEEGFEDDPDMGDGDDDLFGEGGLFADDEPEQPAVATVSQPVTPGGLALPSKNRIALPGSLPQTSDDLEDANEPTQSDVDMDEEEEEEAEEDDPDALAQLKLFREMAAEREERARRGASYQPEGAAETDLETFFNLWPTYNPEERPHFLQLFPQKKGVYAWKTAAKPPKPVQPTKLNLELLPDQEKSFRLPGTATTRDTWLEHQGQIRIRDSSKEQDESDDSMDLDEVDESEIIGGVSWQDFALVCEDWDLPTISSPAQDSQGDSGLDMTFEDDMTPPQKKRKLSHTRFDLKESVAFSHQYHSLDDPERATAKIAKQIQLDLNDPGLLLDENVPLSQPKKLRRLAGDMGREAKSAAARDMTRRYNISNDDAYELLKENHQHKVRSTLGSMAVEHSLPATKLQFPFYRVSLEEKQKRSFHRPTLTNERHEKTIRFAKPKKIKRKELKGKEPTVAFAKAEDLSMADNSNALLLEYSEEQPVMLSNFGMGNRLINYYRRKDDTDTSRPKEELGETQVLLPQDRSPFANFGQVDPGDMVPTVHNGLYRAPIFKHEGKNTDFLVITNHSSQTGRRWYMRNIENIHAVGQQFPSVEVPGEHSRKVTDAAKRRLRAISYRVHKKYIENRGPPLTNEVVRNHLPGSDVAQNRGKMREFMQYDKNHGLWQLKTGEQIPDTETMRAWIKPEDICVLDSMQVGVQHLKDLGLRKDDDENDDDATNEESNIEVLLAPWNTTKNFLNACQGKAMLQLHGEGDPTARGEGFSFIKTSMKGGFRALGESVAEKIDAKKIKENGGHSYNVAKQQRAYDESIRRIWKAQHESLSSTIEHSDVEDDVDDEPENAQYRPAETPRSSFGTPSAFGRNDDTMSQYSKFSANQENNKVMYIDRVVTDKETGATQTITTRVDNPRVIAAYNKRKQKELFEKMELDTYNIVPSGDRENDILALKKYEANKLTEEDMRLLTPEQRLMIEKRVQDELDRLKRNMDRRKARERAKGMHASPSEANSPAPDNTDAGEVPPTATSSKKGRAKKNTEGTARKCANCGQVGHIKTNKKFGTNFSSCSNCSTLSKKDAKNEEVGSSTSRKRKASTEVPDTDEAEKKGGTRIKNIKTQDEQADVGEAQAEPVKKKRTGAYKRNNFADAAAASTDPSSWLFATPLSL